MKRRQLLKLLGLASPTLLIAASCKEKLPTSPTIVTGKIIDENGLPLEGAGLGLSGINWEGFNPIPTFTMTTESDKEGNYKFSQVVPKDTEVVNILPRSTDKVPIGNQGYAHYIILNGSYKQLGAPYDIPRSQWGKTITLNYQFIKQ
ncbi:hypothetical protein CLV98_102500 [Dyadobacter jejuensis]|uniref:Carboxypeptidase regulatory-like domain-containing protein n=1 Tax=Dyadobacter jejuensis TaxID=1082580 RepID=A0A316AQH9_9BACT|nr:carboxypeptidase regulatory-like domain-containing protein [Dyadobacter jejuensis]PWJ59666.1 hypothetical protein CLV98_102500 [Dyadobacter jejuensis]